MLVSAGGSLILTGRGGPAARLRPGQGGQVMQPIRVRFVATVIALGATCGSAMGQAAGPIYTWNGTGNVQQWALNFGGGGAAVSLSNSIAGELTIAESS